MLGCCLVANSMRVFSACSNKSTKHRFAHRHHPHHHCKRCRRQPGCCEGVNVPTILYLFFPVLCDPLVSKQTDTIIKPPPPHIHSRVQLFARCVLCRCAAIQRKYTRTHTQTLISTRLPIHTHTHTDTFVVGIINICGRSVGGASEYSTKYLYTFPSVFILNVPFWSPPSLGIV